ncbi:myosin-XV, partial [Elysia marginata]
GYGVNQTNFLTRDIKPQVKKVIVDTAKEWPTYFCRLFPIAATGQYSGARYLGVSHTGLRLVTRDRTLVDDYLSVLEDIKFEDVIDAVMPNSSTLQLNLRTKSIIFHTTRAPQLKDMIDRFCQESEKGNQYVVAIKDYITRESTLLSFKRGDIIKLMDPEMDLESGWLYGSLNGIVGLFPAECVRRLARHEVDQTSGPRPVLYKNGQENGQALNSARDSHGPDNHSETSQGTAVADGKFSMMEYAMLHFRESLEKYEMLRTDDGSIRGTVKMIEHAKMQNMRNPEQSRRANQDWSWKEQADLIKWTRSPIQASLLKLNSPELNKVALECFIAIMRFMGDYPMGTNMSEFDCAKKILKSCYKYPQLRDEVFCQLCKQTTNNRSMSHKSKIRGWRLFAIVAAYFDCSDVLRPFLFKYLETTATDVQRTYNNAAALCLHNLRKTFKYGGRKEVPLKEEIVALADGRNCKRFPFFYSGADTHGGMLQVKSCTVVQDAIEDVCQGLNITDNVEMEEYTFFVRTDDGAFTKLNREDYILDLTAFYVRHGIHYNLIFQRTVWYFPLRHMDNEIFVEMMYHQCVLDYIEGFLVIMPNGKLPRDTAAEVGYLGAVLHKANEMIGTPTMKDLEVLIPRTVRNAKDSRPQHWLNMVHENLPATARMTSLDARKQFVDHLRNWRLFGSTFFLLKGIPNVANESLLAVNHEGITFLRRDTHETFLQHPFSEILSTRRYRDDSNANFLDMKLGNLMVQQILRIETDQLLFSKLKACRLPLWRP